MNSRVNFFNPFIKNNNSIFKIVNDNKFNPPVLMNSNNIIVSDLVYCFPPRDCYKVYTC